MMARPSPFTAFGILRGLAQANRSQFICENSTIPRAFFSSAASTHAKAVETKDAAAAPGKAVATTGGRKRSRYQLRAPRYYKGPLNPNQPPPASDPSSRAFIPGPFTAERLEDHYYDTLKSDIMTMTYTHLVPGEERARKADRLRSWDDSSPYHKNRPLRGPRGGSTLRLLNKPRTFRNVPGLEKITVHTMVKGALQDKAYLAVAGMVVQAITGVRAEVRNSKQQLATWSLRKDIPIAMKAELKGPQAYRFLSSLVDVVMPRIKDYQGAKGSSGDSSGNISFGFSPEAVALFPEVEVNYDMYPPKMIPGIHVTVHTTATNDKDGRILLQSMGVPFYGKLID